MFQEPQALHPLRRPLERPAFPATFHPANISQVELFKIHFFFFKLKLVLMLYKILCEVFSKYPEYLKSQGGGWGALPLQQGGFAGRILKSHAKWVMWSGLSRCWFPQQSSQNTGDRSSKWPPEPSPPESVLQALGCPFCVRNIDTALQL